MYYFYNLQKSTWLINVYNFLNNSVSTYLLRKQAAAVEDGNRSEEGEGKKRKGRIWRKTEDKTETEEEEEKEIILVTHR